MCRKGWVSEALNLRSEASDTKRAYSINPGGRLEVGAYLGQLTLGQFGKGAGLVKQFLVCTLLNKVTFIKHVNTISIDDSAKAVGNNNAGKLQSFKTFANNSLSFVVQGTGSFVEK